jgi:hypothetical protein
MNINYQQTHPPPHIKTEPLPETTITAIHSTKKETNTPKNVSNITIIEIE